jgi:hypothetical protein
VRGGRPDNHAAEDLKAFGVTEVPPGFGDDEDDEGEGGAFEVLPCNWPAVRVFLACCGQWHISPSGLRTGIRFESIEVAMRRKGVPTDEQDDCWERVTWMERVAADEFTAQHKRERR